MVLPVVHVIDKQGQGIARALIPEIRPGADGGISRRRLINTQDDWQLAFGQRLRVDRPACAEPHVGFAPWLIDALPRVVVVCGDLLGQRKRMIGRLAMGYAKSVPG